MSFFKNLFSKPFSCQLTVTSSNGFHLRPVAQFVNLAKSFSSSVEASFEGKTVDAKKVNALLSLSLEKEDTFTLAIQGKDAEQALEAIEILFLALMQEDKEVENIEKTSHTYESEAFEGEIIAKGIALAPLHRYTVESTQHESTLSFKEAVEASITALESSHSDIHLAQKELLLAVQENAQTLETLEVLITQECQNLEGTKLSAKIADYQDILQRVKSHLGLEKKLIFPEDAFIFLADDLLPSEIEILSKSNVAGVILKETSINSHTAILLRAAGIASLILNAAVESNKALHILDAFSGVLLTSPTEKDIQDAKTLETEATEQKAFAFSKRFEKALTGKGKHIRVFANVGDVTSAKLAKEEGAEGIGLLRSEFLFKEEAPTLEGQTQAYAEIFSLFEDITLRTLDVGGDKNLPYITLDKEDNPFLGIRGVRLFQTHPELLEEQLHAIFLAAKNKKIKIMFPMVSSVEEFNFAKNFAQDVANKYGLDISNILFGIMIEVPSVLFLIKDFNEVVDFYSIGTNDLTQYLFAIERTHTSLKADELSPVIFSALEKIVAESTKPVGICGELAANEKAIKKLVNLGLTTLSVSPKSIASTKEEIRHV